MFVLGRYSIAIFSTAVVIWVRSLLNPWLNERCPFSLFYMSVLLTAWVAGSGPALLAIALGTLAAARFFIPPETSFWIEGVPELVQLVIYVIVNCIAVLLFNRVERQRRLAEERATENVRLGEDLQQADQRKDDFLALLAHELRNPLAPIHSGMALLEKNEDAPEVVRSVRKIVERHTRHLVRITDDLLEVSRFRRGHLEIVMQRIDLREPIRDAIEMIAGAYESKSQLFQSLIPETPVWVNGDHVRLTQLAANLLGNASKYTPESGRIRLVVESHDGTAMVAITDNGIGFSDHHAARIFEPFVQIDESRIREYEGLGVGLTISKRLVELHQGSLSGRSRGPGLGSCFTVTIPLLVQAVVESTDPTRLCDQLQQDVGSRAAPVAEALPKSLPEAASVSPCKLLVVDDNLDASKLLHDLFDCEGYEVQVAHDGMEAIDMAVKFRPTVIVMDIGLPGMDGYEVAKQMRRTSLLSNCKLIALTGWGSEQDRELAALAGFNLHLVKPTGFQALLHHVQTMQVEAGQTVESTV
ncbi:Sensor histidine kinase TodS [Rubripirellula obstinata]|uniref:histidine kinase n=2 Tax=Rubripirellula obstinata TaxID=406547 RepID=A0A5B1C954_9BACT|nr:ATP-binding protein [Rubripirellula obstinata]KAA1257678.1 Sensor histidine kinase TodS [Rubripirellula obstinata]